MERSEFAGRLESAFEKWKGDPNAGDLAALAEAIEFAAKNGIDIQFKVDKDVLHRAMPPISFENAMDHFAGSDENHIIFVVPAPTEGRVIQGSMRLKLEVLEQYRDFKNVLILKHKVKGLLGVFLPEEIASIGVK